MCVFVSLFFLLLFSIAKKEKEFKQFRHFICHYYLFKWSFCSLMTFRDYLFVFFFYCCWLCLIQSYYFKWGLQRLNKMTEFHFTLTSNRAWFSIWKCITNFCNFSILESRNSAVACSLFQFDRVFALRRSREPQQRITIFYRNKNENRWNFCLESLNNQQWKQIAIDAFEMGATANENRMQCQQNKNFDQIE